jgi:hypothetical protein
MYKTLPAWRIVILLCIFFVSLFWFSRNTSANECSEEGPKPCRDAEIVPAVLQTPVSNAILSSQNVSFQWNKEGWGWTGNNPYSCCYAGSGNVSEYGRRQTLIIDGTPYKSWVWRRQISLGAGYDVWGEQNNINTVLNFPVVVPLSCGNHTWQIEAAGCKAVDKGGAMGWICMNEWHYAWSPVRSFIINCCYEPPSVVLKNPASGDIYPADVSAIPLEWELKNNCISLDHVYNKVFVASPVENINTVTGVAGNPAVPLAGTPSGTIYSYPGSYDPKTFRCNSSATAPQVFSWQVRAANINTNTNKEMVINSEVRPFAIAPNYVVPDSTTAEACYTSSNISFNVSLKDLNLITDTYDFKLTDGTNTYNSIISQSSCTRSSPDIYTCTPSFNNVQKGNYRLSFKFSNNSCGGPSNYVEVPTSSGGNIIVGGDSIGSLILTPNESSDYTLDLTVSGATNGDIYSLAYSTDSACGSDCTSCPDASWKPTGDSDSLLSPAPSSSCEIFGSSCRTESFTFKTYGRYCFKASAPGANACGNNVRTGQAAIYVINVKLLNDADNNYACDVADYNKGTPVADQEVVVSGNLTDPPFSKNTTSTGDVRFTLNFEKQLNNPVISAMCPSCTSKPCTAIYTSCAGPISALRPDFTQGQVRYNASLDPYNPQEYSVMLRSGSIPTPKEWFSTVGGDNYAPGLGVDRCSDPTTADALFDGSLMERPEGHPSEYGKNPPGEAGDPYLGGYLFSPYYEHTGQEIEGWSQDNPVYYLSEPQPKGRFALLLTSADSERTNGFSDRNFDNLIDQFNSSEMLVPSNTSVTKLENGDNDFGNGGVFVSDSLDEVAASGEYKLNAGKVAIVYYTGSDDLEFSNSNGFKNTESGNPPSSLLIITPTDVLISKEVGHSCTWDDVAKTGVCGDIGSPLPAEFGPANTPYTPDIEASILSYGSIRFEPTDVSDPVDMVNDIDAMKVVKVTGPLIANKGVEFGRVLGSLSIKYPGEVVVYDSNLLYKLTNLIRSEGVQTSGFSGLEVPNVTIQYQY